MPKTIGKQKYDYVSLKAEFMKNDYLEVKKFFTDKGLIFNSDIVKRTKGWTKEKKAMKEKAVNRAIEKKIEKEAEKLSAQIPLDRLIRMKTDCIDLIDMAIGNMMNAENVDIEKAIKGLNAIKVELQEPTSIGKQEVKETIKDETLSDEDTEILKLLYKRHKG